MNAIAKSTRSQTELFESLDLPALAVVANDAADEVEQHAKSAVQKAIIAGRALQAAKNQCAHGEWLPWLKENWQQSQQLASQYVHVANYQHAGSLESATSVREALRMIADEKAADESENGPQIFNDVEAIADEDGFTCTSCNEQFDTPVWHCDQCDEHWLMNIKGCPICTAGPADTKDEAEPDEIPEEAFELQVVDANKSDLKQWYTIDEWKALPRSTRNTAFETNTRKTFNRQDTTSIEWAQWSWNPLTGCEHDCPYCYARDLANRFYEQKFTPTIYPERFFAPGNTKVPVHAESDVAYRNVFTGSMADIFGRWVPKEWITQVLDTAAGSPQWNFLFLTKFPQRVHEFSVSKNCWMGTTVDCQDRVANAEKAFAKMGGGTKWLSIEPMLTPLKFKKLSVFDWVVIGGASSSSKTPKWVPPLDWLMSLHQQARDAGCRIYYKDNVDLPESLRLQEFPWGDVEQRELPDQLKYLKIK
ncbi:MAG: DUF5131 family protein [Fuerstiella sp.]